MTMPRSPSARAFATNAGSSDRGGNAKAHSQCSAPHSGRRERPQTGRASASEPSASGSGNRQKNHGTRASTAVANGSSQSGAPSHRSASAATMSRRVRADSEARMEQPPPATGHPHPLHAEPSLENAANAQVKRQRPCRGACAVAPRSARPGTGRSPRLLPSSRCGSGRCAPPEHTGDQPDDQPYALVARKPARISRYTCGAGHAGNAAGSTNAVPNRGSRKITADDLRATFLR
jgi:hypothetical protein